MSWKRFIQSHLDVAWAANFSTEEIRTLGAIVTFCTLFPIHLKTRRVYIAGCTANPDSDWVKQQARNFCMVLDDIPETCPAMLTILFQGCRAGIKSDAAAPAGCARPRRAIRGLEPEDASLSTYKS